MVCNITDRFCKKKIFFNAANPDSYTEEQLGGIFIQPRVELHSDTTRRLVLAGSLNESETRKVKQNLKNQKSIERKVELLGFACTHLVQRFHVVLWFGGLRAMG